jgi:hypothetical protein
MGQLLRLRRRLEEVVDIDFFGAPGREVVEGMLASLESRVKPSGPKSKDEVPSHRREEHQGRTCVTRSGIKVDRIASAWLIRRFVDPEARFKFVPAKGYQPEPGELRFDMFDAEFSHEGDACTFEVLLGRFGLKEPALVAAGEIIHDIDLKDGKFGREETGGVARLVQGIAASFGSDEDRLDRGAIVFDALYAGLTAHVATIDPPARGR